MTWDLIFYWGDWELVLYSATDATSFYDLTSLWASLFMGGRGLFVGSIFEGGGGKKGRFEF